MIVFTFLTTETPVPLNRHASRLITVVPSAMKPINRSNLLQFKDNPIAARFVKYQSHCRSPLNAPEYPMVASLVQVDPVLPSWKFSSAP
jgi:hypothetical protein